MANTKVTGDLIASGTITAANLVSGTLDGLLNTYLTTNTYATQSYVTTAVSNLIDAAPASLDTLNELAAALNDDANFATTVTNALATKLNLSGGNITGNLSVDTNVLFVDTVNDRVGIGTSTPTARFQAAGSGFGGISGDHNLTFGTSGANIVASSSNTAAGVAVASFQAYSKASRQKEFALFDFDTNAKAATFGYLYESGGTIIDLTIGNLLNGSTRFLTNGTERMRITSDGNVGIGISSPGSYYSKELVVSAGVEGGITIVSNSTDGAYLMFADGTSGADRYRGYVNYSHTANALAFGTNGEQRVTIDSTGNVGIGTTSPTANLEIVGGATDGNGLKVTGNVASGIIADFIYPGTINGGIRISANTAQTVSSSFYISNRNLRISNDTSGYDIFFNTSGSERMRILSGGNVGIGTSAPQAKFHIEGIKRNGRVWEYSQAVTGFDNGTTLNINIAATDVTNYFVELDFSGTNSSNGNTSVCKTFHTGWLFGTQRYGVGNNFFWVSGVSNPVQSTPSFNVLRIAIPNNSGQNFNASAFNIKVMLGASATAVVANISHSIT